jgi:hypothetical protein
MAGEKEYPITLFKFGEAKEIKTNGEEAVARAQGFTEPYKHQEYPKALYRDGQRVEVTWDSVEKLHDGGCRVVKNLDEEKAARDEGYRMLHDPAPEPEKADDKAADDAGGKDVAKGQTKAKNAK